MSDIVSLEGPVDLIDGRLPPEEYHEPQTLNLEDFRKKAGDGIRTHDVQLWKDVPALPDWFSKPLFAAA